MEKIENILDKYLSESKAVDKEDQDILDWLQAPERNKKGMIVYGERVDSMIKYMQGHPGKGWSDSYMNKLDTAIGKIGKQVTK